MSHHPLPYFQQSLNFCQGIHPIAYPDNVAPREPQFPLKGWIHNHNEASGTFSPVTLSPELCHERTHHKTEQKELKVSHFLCRALKKGQIFHVALIPDSLILQRPTSPRKWVTQKPRTTGASSSTCPHHLWPWYRRD